MHLLERLTRLFNLYSNKIEGYMDFSLKQKACLLAGMLFVSALPAQAASSDVAGSLKVDAQIVSPESWKTFHSIPGNCQVALPEMPQHLKQVMPMGKNNYNLRYDVYVASMGKDAVFMVLIAQYPAALNNTAPEVNLESFLNGILMQNSSNKLIFADLVEVQGNKALDFFIETKGVFFKGRAVIANNNLYLLAMECDMQNYQESHFAYFINSFEIKE